MRHPARKLILSYLVVGVVISTGQNLWGAIASGPTAFAWTGSLAGNFTLLWWWLVVPAVTWPLDLYWTLYHRLR